MDNENEFGYKGPENAPEQVNYQETAYEEYVPPKKQSSMALASLVMGILGILTSCCCFGGLIFGGLGVIFALLSRFNEKTQFEGYAKAGLITSVIGMALAVIAGIAVTIYSIFLMIEGGGF